MDNSRPSGSGLAAGLHSPAGATEEDIERVLAGLAATAHTLRCWVREAGPLVERLAEDHPAAAILAESLAIAEAQPAHLGTPRHLEEAAIEILRGLRQLSATAGYGCARGA